MDLKTTVYLIIDAGGTFIKSAILNTEGEVLEGSSSSVETFSDASKRRILNAFSQTFSSALAYISSRKLTLKGIGIAFPGPFDFKKGIPLMKHKYASIYGLNLRAEFRKISGLRTDIPIKFIHDVNAVLEGELINGKAKAYTNVALVTLGTGLGFSYCLNRQVQRNKLGSPLVAIYKNPYKNGIVEDYVSKRGILKIYHELGGDGLLNDVANIAAKANNGDEVSIETFCDTGYSLASAINNFLDQNKIECLLFSGQISRSFHLLEPTLKEGLQNVKSLKKITSVQSISNAGLLGIFYGLKDKFNLIQDCRR